MTLIHPHDGPPDKQRLIAAMRCEPTDRVPNIEILIEDRHVERLLGRQAGNTLGVGGDPAKGSEAAEGIRPMYPADGVHLAAAVGRDDLAQPRRARIHSPRIAAIFAPERPDFRRPGDGGDSPPDHDDADRPSRLPIGMQIRVVPNTLIFCPSSCFSQSPALLLPIARQRLCCARGPGRGRHSEHIGAG